MNKAEALESKTNYVRKEEEDDEESGKKGKQASKDESRRRRRRGRIRRLEAGKKSFYFLVWLDISHQNWLN